MARSSGSIHIADNSVVSINDAIQQLLFMIDELKGEHNTTNVTIANHTHAIDHGGLISHDTGLTDVSANDHHNQIHSIQHGPGGSDTLKLDDCASPDDNSDLNASAAAHGLLPKLSNNAATFLDGTGVFSTPTVVGTEAQDVTNIDASESVDWWEIIHAAGHDAFSGDKFIRKNADESLTSNTTLQNDDELFIEVQANEKWYFEIKIFLTSTSETPDIKYSITGPAGITGKWAVHGVHDLSALGTRDYTASARTAWDGTVNVALGSINGTTIHFLTGIAHIGSTAGKIQLQWAQNTSNVATITVEDDSFILARRIS